MTSKSHLTRCATFAIATLALGSTPLLAQDAAAPPAGAAPPPTIVIPDVAPPPPPAPTIVIPEELTQPQPQAAAPATPARTPPRAAAPAQTRAAAPRPAPAAAAPEPATPDTTTTDTAPLEAPIAAAPLPEPVAQPEPAPTTEQTREAGNTLAIVLGVLAALALLVLGFFALRRKGPKRYAAAAPTIEKPVVRREPAEQPLAELPEGTGAPEFPAAPEPEPVLAQPNVSYSGAAFGAAKPAGGLSHSGASVALPRELPKTYEEREALIQRMIAAPPDRANPFRSYRARLKRARLILASLGRDFKDADPWIDLSQYPSNWPELARRQSAAA